jgi:hypothetical protein
MFRAEKRIKLSSENNKNKNDSAAISDSIDQGVESDFNSPSDFTLPPVKRRCLTSRQASNKQSFEHTGNQSSGYSSLLSSSSSLSPARKSRTPKRKSEASEADENAFYNSYQFVSPCKKRKNDPSDTNRAKLILKEKSSSENVILSSTPIRNNNKNKLWGKFRSLHPEKFEIGRSLDDDTPIEKSASILPKSTEISFNIGSSFDLTNSFNITSNVETPEQFHELCYGSINIDTTGKQPAETLTKHQLETVKEQQEPIEELQTDSLVSQISSSSSIPRTRFHCGRLRMDILGALHKEGNLAVQKVLSHLSDRDLLNVSQVSKNYRQMIKSNKTFNTKTKKYLKLHRNWENRGAIFVTKKEKDNRTAFGSSNINHSMQLRPKPDSPPSSPSRKRFLENQKVRKSSN